MADPPPTSRHNKNATMARKQAPAGLTLFEALLALKIAFQTLTLIL
jgi:hypothetical protein